MSSLPNAQSIIRSRADQKQRAETTKADLSIVALLLKGLLPDHDECLTPTVQHCFQGPLDYPKINKLRVQAKSAYGDSNALEFRHYLSALAFAVLCPKHQHEHPVLWEKWDRIVDILIPPNQRSSAVERPSVEIPVELMLPRCPICWDEMIEIRRTHCGHAFCEGCLDDFKENGLTGNCPICRAVLFEGKVSSGGSGQEGPS